MRTLIFTLIICGAFVSQAQHHDRHEKIKQLKVAYLSEKLELSVTDGQQFWPVYNAYEKDRKELERSHRHAVDVLEHAENVTEASIYAVLREQEQLARQLEARTEAYVKDVINVLGVQRTAVLLSSEDEFRKRVVREWKERRGHRGDGK